MLLINPYRFAAPRSSDADVNSYILAVEAADGQQLEAGVITAVEDFVIGCKSDGIWSAIKASCILAGARTLSGALVQLVGTAPTNNNFVAADYNRKTGLVGNATTKYLNTNTAGNIIGQNNRHMVFYKTSSTASTVVNIGYDNNATCFDHILNLNPTVYFRINSAVAQQKTLSNAVSQIGLHGFNRSSSLDVNYISGSISNSSTSTSVEPLSLNIFVFANNRNGNPSSRSNERLSFYSFGESLNLALLNSRVSTLMTDLAAAIP